MAAIIWDEGDSTGSRRRQFKRTKDFNQWLYYEHVPNGGGDFDGFVCEGDLRMLFALCPASGKYDFGGNFKAKVPKGYIRIATGQFYVFAKEDDRERILDESL